MRTMFSIDNKPLPPLLKLWQAPNSNRRKEGVPTVAELLQVGKTTVFGLVKRGEIQVVRLGKRTTLGVTQSVIDLLRSSTGQGA